MTDSDLDQTPGHGDQLTRSLDRLTEALAKAATASERYAKRLVWATWTLVFATLVLAAVVVAERYFALPPADDESVTAAAKVRQRFPTAAGRDTLVILPPHSAAAMPARIPSAS